MTKLKNRWLLWILPLAFFVSCKSNEGQWENKQIQQTAWGVNCIWTDGAI